LCVLNLLDKLHFNALHIHDLFFFGLAEAVFNVGFIGLAALGHHDLSLAFLLDLHLGKTLLLAYDLVLHLVLGFHFELLVAPLLLVLSLYYLCLLRLLLLREVDRFLNFPLFLLSLLVYHIVLSRLVALLFVLKLVVVYFLQALAGGSHFTFCIRSSFLFLSETISFVRFLVSSIFFQVFISSCFSNAILLARS